MSKLNTETQLPQTIVSKSVPKIKTYVLTVSEFFPKTHNKSGFPTGFIDKIGSKIKKHTIRGNYPLWKKRIEEIQKGNAVLSIRYWIGKPYNSKQKEVYVLDKNSGIGVQDLYFDRNNLSESFISNETAVDGIQNYVSNEIIAENDGLSLDDFKEWFKGYDLNEPMAIVHFTDERY
jgi:hypothetical protein